MKLRTLTSIVLPLTLVCLVGCNLSESRKNRSANILVGRKDKNSTKEVQKSASNGAIAAKAEQPPALSSAQEGMIHTSVAHPTGNRSTSVILIEKLTPEQVGIAKPFDFFIKVTNLTDMHLTNVVVSDQISEELTVNESIPKMMEATIPAKSRTVRWLLNKLGPREKKVVHINATATSTGLLLGATEVSYETLIHSSIEVVQPALKATIVAPEAVILCDPLVVDFKITNLGTGTARNVKIERALGEHLQTSEGKSNVALDVGSLEPGQSRTYSTILKALKPGDYSHQIIVTGDDGLKIESNTASTIVKRPVLTLECQGREKQFLGQTISYEITVANTGDGVAKNVFLEFPISGIVEFIGASDEGKLFDSRVLWKLGNLDPQVTKKINLTLRASSIASFQSQAKLTADCAEPKEFAVATEIRGIPAILLEVGDLADPTEIGGEATYVITVSNQGSAVGTGIQINCKLEDTMEYVSASGPTDATVNGKSIVFKPLATLKPSAKVTWKVTVKATEEADVRFQVEMQSDQTSRPVIETEATTFYK